MKNCTDFTPIVRWYFHGKYWCDFCPKTDFVPSKAITPPPKRTAVGQKRQSQNFDRSGQVQVEMMRSVHTKSRLNPKVKVRSNHPMNQRWETNRAVTFITASKRQYQSRVGSTSSQVECMSNIWISTVHQAAKRRWIFDNWKPKAYPDVIRKLLCREPKAHHNTTKSQCRNQPFQVHGCQNC